ncbi:MAG: XTP/dITP diphosphatase [Desulfatibacillaceae bacterium]|nr:XTP/dITP diphosphatase [Desulfatibacillaceae bacterium]
MKPKVIVLATKNEGKVAEIRQMLDSADIVIKSLDDFGPFPQVEEDGDTFDENAYKKASKTAAYLGFAALADDSGLVVEALGGLPGVHSARFGGPGLSDADKCGLLLKKMEGVQDRRAAFECVISIALPTGQALTYEGRVEGLITTAPAGESGFGYDPVFFYPPENKTFAQMGKAQKNAVSHRGKAIAQVAEEIGKIIKWMEIHEG